MLSVPGQLFFRRVLFSQRHRDELADYAFLIAIAVEPGLLRNDDVILRVGVQVRRPFVAADCVDLAGGDLDGEGVLDVAARRVEANSQSFRLVHRHDHTAAFEPDFWDASNEVVEMA